jgi:decaprenylphospho-beta-D-erythro-pentofuranosid-2-ulose 2-reductase
MLNALGVPQSVLLLGGTSEIALAVARRWSATKPRVVLAARAGARRDEAAAALEAEGFPVRVLDFDAEDTATHTEVIRSAAAQGDIDVAVVAVGVLGDEEEAWQDHDAAVRLARVNFTGAVSVGVLLAGLLRRQGHGVVVALSSVAGERVRRKNFVYGSTKAGMDAFYRGLGQALTGSGARVLVVRPGFVRTRMTEGRDPAPLAVGPDEVAAAVEAGIVSGRSVVWAPAPMRVVSGVLRTMPGPVFRRLPI